MSSPAAPPPPRSPIRDIKRAMRDAELSPASWPTQVAAYLEIVLAIGLFCAWLDAPLAFAATSAALGGGILVGVLTPVGQWFRTLSGVVAALVSMFITIVLLGFTDGRLFGEEPVLIACMVGLAVLGLDWRFVPRLRARTVASGLLVVPLIGTGASWAIVGAVSWTVGLLASLWLVERDLRAAALRPVPLTTDPPAPRADVFDILRAAGIGLAIGLVAAMLFGDATCSFRQDDGAPTQLSRPDPSAPSSGSGPASGPRPDVAALRDEAGDLLAVITDDGITVYGSDGGGRTYQLDEDRSLSVRGSDGQRYTIEPDGSGWALRDESGEVVSRAEPSPAPTAADDDPSEEAAESDVPWELVGVVVIALAAIAGLIVWLLRRPRSAEAGPTRWADRLARRLADEGRRRGRGRGTGETVLDHSSALARGPLPDPRVAEVGVVLSSALFSRHEPPPHTQQWAESVVDEVSRAHPPLTRRERRRGRRVASSSPTKPTPPTSSRT